MKKLLIIVLSLCSLAWSETTTTNAEGPALTIYNQNFFVAREYLPLDLTTGVNHVNFAGITSHLEPDSVILRDLTGRPLQILEQSYRNDPVSQELLLSMYEGKTIDFLVQRGDRNETIKGKIIRSGYVPSSTYSQNGYPQPGMGQPIIEIEGVLRFGLPGLPLFPALGGDSILKPTLTWQLSTTQAGASQAEISYVSGGMTWQSDYNLVVSDGAKNSGMLWVAPTRRGPALVIWTAAVVLAFVQLCAAYAFHLRIMAQRELRLRRHRDGGGRRPG